MSEFDPGMCRSLGCDERAEFYVEVLEGMQVQANWNGEFCRPHLVRCMDLKVQELNFTKHTVIIERMVWLDNPTRRRRHERMIRAINNVKRVGA